MANEQEVNMSITVRDTSNFSEDISSFCLKRQFSDITLIFDDQKVYAELFAHKVILAARCQYFKSLLAKDPGLTEIAMKGVSAKAFKKILTYIYTGTTTFVSSDFELILDVMKLASAYSLPNLEKAISEKVSSVIKMDNVFDILNKANEFEMKGLRNVCHIFMDEYSTEILKSEYFINLTQKSMIRLLERDSFMAPEIEIFKSVAKWCRRNQDKNGLAMQCVRLSSLTNEEILSTVYPTNLIESNKLLALMAKSNAEKPKSTRYKATLIKNDNIASVKYEAQVISGSNTAFLLNGDRSGNNYAYHYVNDKNGITVKLKSPSYINHIHMKLLDTNTRYYSYYIEVSLDKKKWQRVVDYSRYHCRSYQNLFFDKVLVQYIRVTGTFDSANTSAGLFYLVFFECYFKTNYFKVTSTGIEYPSENVADRNKGAVVIQGENGQGLLMNDSNAFTDAISDNSNPAAIIVQLAQPYMISSIRFLLPSTLPGAGSCGYSIETSVDRTNWQTAIDNRNLWCSSWQDFQFEERPVVYIKITDRQDVVHGTTTMMRSSGALKCACLECPSRTKL